MADCRRKVAVGPNFVEKTIETCYFRCNIGERSPDINGNDLRVRDSRITNNCNTDRSPHFTVAEFDDIHGSPLTGRRSVRMTDKRLAAYVMNMNSARSAILGSEISVQLANMPLTDRRELQNNTGCQTDVLEENF